MYVYVANNCNIAMALRGLPDRYVCSYLCMTEDRGTQARGLWEHIKQIMSTHVMSDMYHL